MVKEILPIFAHDYFSEEIIKPFRDEGFNFPLDLVFAFITEDNLQKLVQQYHAIEIGEFLTVSNTFKIYQVQVNGKKICLSRAPLGAPAAVQLLDFLIAYGVKNIIAIGSCGVLTDIEEGKLFVVEHALRDEGTSSHYLKPATDIKMDEALTANLKSYLLARRIDFAMVNTWTTDAFFRETKALVEKNIQAGYTVVEMEAAALCACATFRGVKFAQVLYAGDSLADVDKYDDRDFGMDSQLVVTNMIIKYFSQN